MSTSSPKARRTLKTFTYATSNNPAGCTEVSAVCDARNGKVLTALRHNRGFFGDVVVTESYVYKGLGGRVSARDTSVSGPAPFPTQLFRTSQTWSNIGLVSSITYPWQCPAGD